MKEGFCHGWKPNSWLMVNYQWRVLVGSGRKSQSFGYGPRFFWANEALCKRGDLGPVLESASCFSSDYQPLMSCEVNPSRTKLTITLDWSGHDYRGEIASLLLEQPVSVTFEQGQAQPQYSWSESAIKPLRPISFAVPVEYTWITSGNVGGVCGSGWSTALVPDHVCFGALGIRSPYEHCESLTIPHKVDFVVACSRHDACYGTKGATKADCDTSFYQDLKQACFSHLPETRSDSMLRACIETALLYNDVVRGQATRRLEIWFGTGKVTLPVHVQQVPFTGMTGCGAYLKAQRKAGNRAPSCKAGDRAGGGSW